MKSRTFGLAPARSIHHVKQFYNWEFEDDERKIIREWSKNRIKKMQGLRKSYHGMLVYSFHLSTIKSFIENFNIIVLIQMLIAGGAVYLFQTYNIAFEFHVALVVSPIVFPLAFSINTDFQRREKVLDDLANFKSSAMVWFFCVREWRIASGLDVHWLNAVQKKVHSMMFNLREYLLTERLDRRQIIARYMYEDFSDTSQLIEGVRDSKLPANTAIVSRAIHLLNGMCLAFERLRVIREYRSPRSIRAFNKVLIFLLPIILCPYFVSLGKRNTVPWSPYVIAVVVAGVFGALQGVQDKLDDPFDGMSEDDINLDTIDEWTFTSLDTAATRNLVIGRFHVSKDVKDLETAAIQRRKSLAEYMHRQETQESLSENVDSTNTITRKSPFHKRKTAKSFFRRSARKGSSLNRSKTIGGADTNRGRDRLSTSSYTFTPELHPFADMLENMSGETRITRKNTLRVHPSRQNSMEEEFPRKDSTGNNTVYSPSSSLPKHSIVSIIKEIPLDDDNDNNDITIDHKKPRTISETSHKKRKKVSYADSYVGSIEDLKNSVHKETTRDHYSTSPSEVPLLSNNTPPDTPPTLNHKGRFQVNSTSTPPQKDSMELQNYEGTCINQPRSTLKSTSLEDPDDSELRQVVVVNGSDVSYTGNHHDDVFS